MIPPLSRPSRLAAAAGRHLQSPFLLIVRLYWGWQFMQTGWGKLTNLDRIVPFFKSLGLPAPAFTATAVGTLELTGGFLLIVGLFSRVIAVPMTFSMIMAYITANREALASVFSDPGKFYGADPYTFLFAVLLVLIFGPGRFSLDRILESRFQVVFSLNSGFPGLVRLKPRDTPAAVDRPYTP
jgi:putative oxidoreductase